MRKKLEMRSLWLATAVAVVIGVPVQRASAEEQAAPIEEIVVTAQRRSQSLQDVPITINAMGEDQIDELGIEKAADLAGILPGLTVGEFAGTANISIRGVGTTIVSGAGEGSVALHLDGIFMPSTLMGNLAQKDLGRIEVLRGPQSTLYGRNATGGVINFFSAAPEEGFSAGASATAGNYDYRAIEGYVTGALSDRVRARLYAEGEERDGYTDNVITGQDLDDLQGVGGRLAIDAEVMDSWDAELRVTLRQEDSAQPVYDPFDPSFSPFPAPLVAFDPRETATPVDVFSEKEFLLASLKNEFHGIADDVTLVSLTGYTHLENDSRNDALGIALGTPLSRDEEVTGISQEFNLVGESVNTSWVVGVYGLHQENDNQSFTDFSAIGLPNNSVFMKSERDAISAFGDLEYAFTDKWSGIVGARLGYERVETDLTVLAGFTPLCTPESVPQKETDEYVTGRLGLNYQLSDDALIYGQVSRGYKAGGFSFSNCDNPYDPEKLDAVEIGIKSRSLDGRLVANVSGYYYDYRDLQLELATASGIPVENADEAHVFGADIELNYLPTATWEIGLALTLLDAEYDEFINRDPNFGVPIGTDLSGVRLNNAAPISGTLSIQKDFLFDIGSFRFRGEAYMTDDYNLREFDEPYVIQDGYTSLNFYGIYADPSDRFEARAFVKNATDETVLAGVLGFGGPFGVWQTPRFYGIELTARY